jgi:hypothetical protein
MKSNSCFHHWIQSIKAIEGQYPNFIPLAYTQSCNALVKSRNSTHNERLVTEIEWFSIHYDGFWLNLQDFPFWFIIVTSVSGYNVQGMFRAPSERRYSPFSV